MKLFRDVICQMGKGYGYPLIAATIIEVSEFVPLAKKAPTQTSVVNQAPWVNQAPYLNEAFMEANKNYWGVVRDANGNIIKSENGRAINGPGNPLKFFPGQTYASFSPQTERALNLTEQRAMAGSPTQQIANTELQRTLGGDYLHGGSGFNAAFQAAANKIIPDVESRFNRGGRFNSGLARQAETSALADAFASQYGNERQNQLRAMLFAPQAAEADYADLSRLAGVGQAREGQTQSAIDEAMLRHQFEQMEPSERLGRYLQMVQGHYGGTGTETISGFKGNKGAGILGGALGGAKAGAAIDPLWGTIAGGILGGGLGAFT